MITIGVTGIIGSGKTTVSTMLRRKGLKVVDLDGLAKKAITRKEVQEEIIDRIGKEYVKDGTVAVEKLRDKVFDEKGALSELENIIHPKVIEGLNRELARLKKQGIRVVVVDAPLLFEKGLNKEVDRTVVVSAETEKIRQRLKARGLTQEDMTRRMSHQIPLKQKEEKADFIVFNNGSREDLETRVDELLRRIKEWEVSINAS